jgi:hypothetical protein
MDIFKPYLAMNARHKLLFTQKEVEGIAYVDIGLLLSKAIESAIDSKRLVMKADDELEKIINSNLKNSSEIGEYIAIKNIGILFEPSLKIDLHTKIDSWAKSHVLIILKEGKFYNDIYYLSSEKDSSYSINLNDINYKTIYDEI